MAAHLNSRLVNPTVLSLISDIFVGFCNISSFEYNYTVESRSRPQFWICVVTADILGMGHFYTGSGTHSDTLHIIPFAIEFALIFRHWTPCLPTHVVFHQSLFF